VTEAIGTNQELFELQPAWSANGEAEHHIVDSPDGLFDAAPLQKTEPLAGAWLAPTLVIVTSRRAADVYYCPGGCYLFSDRARALVDPLVAKDVEWLPVEINGLGSHFALHPLRQVPLAQRAKYRINEVSKNIVDILQCAFDSEDIAGASIFYASQAPGSAAAEAGFCLPSVFVSAPVAIAITSNLVGLSVVPRCFVRRDR
jgi:hypothetical protein